MSCPNTIPLVITIRTIKNICYILHLSDCLRSVRMTHNVSGAWRRAGFHKGSDGRRTPKILRGVPRDNAPPDAKRFSSLASGGGIGKARTGAKLPKSCEVSHETTPPLAPNCLLHAGIFLF